MNLIEKEQLAAQIVAVMDAHLSRPDAGLKQQILKLADQQIDAVSQLASDAPVHECASERQ